MTILLARLLVSAAVLTVSALVWSIASDPGLSRTSAAHDLAKRVMQWAFLAFVLVFLLMVWSGAFADVVRALEMHPLEK